MVNLKTALASIVMVLLGFLVMYTFVPSEKAIEQPVVKTTALQLEDDPDQAVAYWIEKLESMPYEEAYLNFSNFNKNEPEKLQHTNAHYFGEALYRVAGVDGVSICDSSFAFGCYHSLFSWGLAEHGSSIIGDFDQACIEAYGPKGLGCQHGIGHGLLAEMGADKLLEALDLCRTLNWQGSVGGCTSGVFMEYNFNTMWEGPVRLITEQSGSHYPCTEMPERFTEACYHEMPQWWMSIEKDNFSFASAECAQAVTEAGRHMCFRGLGKEVAVSTKFSISTTLDMCSSISDNESQMLCIEGATWMMAYEPARAEDWTMMCDRLEGDEKKRCLESKNLI